MTAVGAGSPPPTSNRQGIADALGAAQAEQGAGVEGEPQEELSEVQERIVRIEEILLKRGVAHEGDFAPTEPDDGSGAPADPSMQGAPPPQGVPQQ